MQKKINRGAMKTYSTLLVFLLCFAFYAACYANMK